MSDEERKIKEDIAGALQILSDPYAIKKDDGALITDDGELLVITEQGKRYSVHLEDFDEKKKEETRFALVRVVWPDDPNFAKPNTPAYLAFHMSDENLAVILHRLGVLEALKDEDEVGGLCSLSFWDEMVTPIALQDALPEWADAMEDCDCLVLEGPPTVSLDANVEEVLMLVASEGVSWSMLLKGEDITLGTTPFDPRPFP
jgi:hypothetical protein